MCVFSVVCCISLSVGRPGLAHSDKLYLCRKCALCELGARTKKGSLHESTKWQGEKQRSFRNGVDVVLLSVPRANRAQSLTPLAGHNC